MLRGRLFQSQIAAMENAQTLSEFWIQEPGIGNLD